MLLKLTAYIEIRSVVTGAPFKRSPRAAALGFTTAIIGYVYLYKLNRYNLF